MPNIDFLLERQKEEPDEQKRFMYRWLNNRWNAYSLTDYGAFKQYVLTSTSYTESEVDEWWSAAEKDLG